MKKYLETKPGSLEEAVLISRGLIEQTEYTISMRDASFFKGNDIKKAMTQSKRDGNTDKALEDLDMVGGDDEEGITFTARSPSEAVKNAEKAILDYRNKEVNRDRNALFVFNDLELQLVGDELPSAKKLIAFADAAELFFNSKNMNISQFLTRKTTLGGVRGFLTGVLPSLAVAGSPG